MGPGCTSEPEADPLSTKTEVSTHPCHSENRPQGAGAASRGGRERAGTNTGQTSGRRPRPSGLQEPLLPAVLRPRTLAGEIAVRTVRGLGSALSREPEARCGVRGQEAAFPKEKATTGRTTFYFLCHQRSRSSVGWACPPCAHPGGDPVGPQSTPGHVRGQSALCAGTRHAPAAREIRGNRHPHPSSPPTCFSDLVKPDRDQRPWPVRTRTAGRDPGGGAHSESS